MDTLQQLSAELEQEYNITKKFFELYPDGKGSYKPHPKSYSLSHLVTHIVEIFGWPGFMLQTEELDLGKTDYRPTPLDTKTDLLAALEKNKASSQEALQKATGADLEKNWRLAHNGQTLAEWTKYSAMRHALNQITHHRAQLGVYYRLNDIPLPGSYGPSADDQQF
ncbi:damage-inducible protein DinB [Niabella ginsenosidivorans]|uniref:Damage-inducible protein DinB n=1 Tax=Niabella ginsenosidivorans TaxID=1176587 RepID=A0A1A9IBH1_9BACT|nr:DinB family protein [Niabella ginsenosidivorans]ANH84082.1 damage-inducible protein DinB [Niabella ginsenosidivorans]